MSQLTLFTCAPDPFEALETAGRFLSSAAVGIATFHARRKIVDPDHRERSIIDVHYLRQYHAHNDVDHLALDNLHAVVQTSRLGFKLFTDMQWDTESRRRYLLRRAEQEAQRRRERDAEAAAMQEASRIYRERMLARERVRSEAMESAMQPTGRVRAIPNPDGLSYRSEVERAMRWVICTRDERTGDTITREVNITDELMHTFTREAEYSGIPIERVIEQFFSDGHDIQDRQRAEREQRSLYGSIGSPEARDWANRYIQNDLTSTRAAQNHLVQGQGVPVGRSVFEDPGPLRGDPGPGPTREQVESAYNSSRRQMYAEMYGATGENRPRVGVMGDWHHSPLADPEMHAAREWASGATGDFVPAMGDLVPTNDGDESSLLTQAHIERIQRIGARMDREVAEMMSSPVPMTVTRSEPTEGLVIRTTPDAQAGFTVHGARTSRMSGGGGLNAAAPPRHSQAENRMHRVGGTPPVIIDYEALPDDATLLENVRRMRNEPNDYRTGDYTLTSRVSVNEAEFTNQTLGEPWRPESPTGRTPSEPNAQHITRRETRPILDDNGEPATLMGYPLVTEIGPDERDNPRVEF